MTPSELKRIRLSMGLSQERFATLIGRSPYGPNISKIENGHAKVPTPTEIIVAAMVRFGPESVRPLQPSEIEEFLSQQDEPESIGPEHTT